MGQVTGQAKVKINGALLDTDGQTTLDIGGTKREAVNGDYQAGNYRCTTVESKVEVSVLVKRGTSLAGLRNTVDATITVEFDTGQTYVIRNGWSGDVPTAATNDGKAKCVFMGAPAEEVLQ